MTDTYVLRRMIEAEQREVATMLRDLTDAEWEQPSLCDGWSVHDAVLHIAWHTHTSDLVRPLDLVRSRVTARDVHAQDRQLTKQQLIDKLASPPVLAGQTNVLTQLAELVTHQQDVRRPLGLARDIAADRMCVVLDFAHTRAGGSVLLASSRRRSKGLRLVATDVDWSVGTGPEVVGTGEAIYMAINGRSHVLADLGGDGASVLVAR